MRQNPETWDYISTSLNKDLICGTIPFTECLYNWSNFNLQSSFLSWTNEIKNIITKFKEIGMPIDKGPSMGVNNSLGHSRQYIWRPRLQNATICFTFRIQIKFENVNCIKSKKVCVCVCVPKGPRIKI